MRAVGLDIGEYSVKAAVVETAGRKTRFVKFGEVEYDDPSPGIRSAGEVSAAVKKLFHDYRLPKNNVYVRLRSDRCVVRSLLLPFTREDQIRKTIRFEVEAHVHNISIENMIIEYRIIDRTPTATKVLVLCAPRKLLGEITRMGEDLGIEIPEIDLDGFTLFNIAKYFDLAPPEESVIIADLGFHSATVVLAEKGEIKLVRSATAGTSSIAKEIADAYKTDYASGLRLSEGRPAEIEGETRALYGDELSKFRDGYVKRVAKELSRTVVAEPIVAPVSAVYITGGGAALPQATEVLSEELGVPVSLVGPGDKVELAGSNGLDAFQLRGLVAFGLALKGLRLAELPLDFRKEEFVHKKKFEYVKMGLLVFGALCFLMIAFVALNLKQSYAGANGKMKSVENSQKAIWTRVFKEEKKPYPGVGRGRALAELIAFKGELEEKVGLIKGLKPRQSVVSILGDFIYQLDTHAEGVLYNITGVRMRRSTCVLTLVVASDLAQSDEWVSSLYNAPKNSTLYSAEVSEQPLAADNKTLLTFTLKFNEYAN